MSGTTYHPLAERSAAITTATQLNGIVTRTDPTTGNISGYTATGALNHVTGATSLNIDSGYTISDPNGPDANGTLTDGGTNFIRFSYYNGAASTPYFSGAYQYVTSIEGNYVLGGSVYTMSGVYGNQTSPADVPTTGTATYVGEAGGTWDPVYAGTYTRSLTAGSSRVNVDFTNASADVIMNNFTIVAPAGAVITPDTFDEVRITGSSLVDNYFGAGGTTFYKNGKLVPMATVIGAFNGAALNGVFYGYDSSIGAPAEVGGTYFIDGAGGTLKLVFLAK